MAFPSKYGKLLRLTPTLFTRRYNSTVKKGLVLGVYSEEGKGIQLTSTAEKFNETSSGKLIDSLNLAGGELKQGKNYVFWGLDEEFRAVAVVGLGKPNQGYDAAERIHRSREAVRIAASSGCKALAEAGIKDIRVEDFDDDSESAAEGSILSTWKFQEYKTKKEESPTVSLYTKREGTQHHWNKGAITAGAQNLARRLADTPSNLMTPAIFAQNAADALVNLGVQVEIHDEAWAEAQKMHSFLSVTRGTQEPAKFLELTYSNCGDDNPFVFIGKGVTFDSGGISLKPSASMDEMRADMSGAACLVGTLKAIAELKLQANLKVLIPLAENMPSGSATKPGDVITAMNGKTVCVDNTDAEGRLVLADALCYSKKFNPKWILDIATLTGAMRVALGATATGVFSNSDALYDCLEKAGSETGDRVWRMPLWKAYTKLIAEFPAYDVNNVGKGKGRGGACTAAAFLKEFVPEKTDWMHLDIAGVMGPSDPTPYLTSGMTGRPTRTLIQFVSSQLNAK